MNDDMSLEDKTKKVILGKEKPKEVTIVTTPLTQAEARQIFLYRPFSKYAESIFGGDNLYDDVCLLLNGLAQRCEMCQAPTKKEYLSPHCPDCDGRSEYNGTNPRTN